MPDSPEETTIWACPQCGKRFRVPIRLKPPAQCKSCRSASSEQSAGPPTRTVSPSRPKAPLGIPGQRHVDAHPAGASTKSLAHNRDENDRGVTVSKAAKTSSTGNRSTAVRTDIDRPKTIRQSPSPSEGDGGEHEPFSPEYPFTGPTCEAEAWQEAMMFSDDVKTAGVFCGAVKVMLWIQFAFWLEAAFRMYFARGVPFLTLYSFASAGWAYVAIASWWTLSRPHLTQWISNKTKSFVNGPEGVDWSLIQRIQQSELGMRKQAVVEFFIAALFAVSLAAFSSVVCRISDPALACVLPSIFFWFRSRGAMRKLEVPFDIRYWGGMLADSLAPIAAFGVSTLFDADITVCIAAMAVAYATMLLFVLRFLRVALGVSIGIEDSRGRIVRGMGLLDTGTSGDETLTVGR
jgi:hypothetical protein